MDINFNEEVIDFKEKEKHFTGFIQPTRAKTISTSKCFWSFVIQVAGRRVGANVRIGNNSKVEFWPGLPRRA